MAKMRVWGDIIVSVSCVVDVEQTEDMDSDDVMELAFEKASEEFGGVTSFVGNGGTNKLIGVYGSNESIASNCSEVDWNYIESI